MILLIPLLIHVTEYRIRTLTAARNQSGRTLTAALHRMHWHTCTCMPHMLGRTSAAQYTKHLLRLQPWHSCIHHTRPLLPAEHDVTVKDITPMGGFPHYGVVKVRREGC
jgi:hypothetical protein